LSAVAIKADESEAVSFSSDEQFRMWDLRTYQEKDIVLPPAGSKFLGFKPETLETLLMVHGDRLVLWDPRSNESKGILAECPGITHALLFPAMQRVVTANEGDKLVRLWHLGTGTMLKELAGHTDSVSALVAVPGTNCVLSASYDETMKLWDLETGNAIRTFEGHKGPVDVVVVTPDARQVVSASRDTTLKIWDLQTEETLHTLTGHTYSVHDVAVMREGRFVISVSGDSTAKAWSLSDGNLVAEYYADNPIHRCAVSSENGPIVLGDGLGRLHFLRLDGI
jgi:WD40 repeat protein